MPEPQRGIFENTGPHHTFLEYSVLTTRDVETARDSIRAAWDLLEEDPAVAAVMGFGGELWDALRPGTLPAQLVPFRTLTGRRGKSIPGTQNDLWWWLSAPEQGQVFRAALSLQRTLASVAIRRLEQPGFRYLDSRDLTGFVDGSANPSAEEAPEVALIPTGATGAGGSYVLAMRWAHDLAAFHALPQEEQEQVIGRTKPDSVELKGDAMPATSHVSRVEVELKGEEAPIYRRSVPFGTVDEHGLYFLAFSASPDRFDLMLRRMYGLTEDGIEDRLTDYSRATASSYYYAPSQAGLAAALDG